jgi:hypothetical protein
MDLVTYLRQTAQTCTRLARACPHQATAHSLEAIAVDLMAKAGELESEHRIDPVAGTARGSS